MTDRLDSLLDRAAKAARTRAEAGADDGAATRLRIRESLAAHRATPSRRRLFTILAAILGSLFGSFAFAAYVAGWNPLAPAPAAAPAVAVDTPPPATHPPHARTAPPAAATMPDVNLPGRIVPDAAVVIAAPPEGRAVTIEAPPPSSPAPALPEVDKPVVPAKPAPRAKTVPRASTVRPAAPPAASPRTEPPAPPAPRTEPPAPHTDPPPAPPAKSDDLADYRVAHEAHFRGHDAPAALAAWDAYLARHAQSQLAPDARYNRALVLIKLARYAEARQALAPFATAPAGSYRQADAAKLLAALPGK